MAANSSSRGVATLGKRLVTQIWATQSSSTRSLSAPVFRRSMQTSSYDKNVDDQVNPVVVPDYIVQPQSDKYWGPNPNTGVFGPGTEQNLAGSGFRTSPMNGGSDSVLEEKAFFRPLEDLDKSQEA